jgi:hypothetical protein
MAISSTLSTFAYNLSNLCVNVINFSSFMMFVARIVAIISSCFYDFIICTSSICEILSIVILFCRFDSFSSDRISNNVECSLVPLIFVVSDSVLFI